MRPDSIIYSGNYAPYYPLVALRNVFQLLGATKALGEH